MEYRKNVKIEISSADATISLVHKGNILSAIVKNPNGKKVASIDSIKMTIGNDEHFNGFECFYVQSINAISNYEIMFRLQQFFYESVHNLGYRYLLFETRNPILLDIAKHLYVIEPIKETNCYIADLDRMFYHSLTDK